MFISSSVRYSTVYSTEYLSKWVPAITVCINEATCLLLQQLQACTLVTAAKGCFKFYHLPLTDARNLDKECCVSVKNLATINNTVEIINRS